MQTLVEMTSAFHRQKLTYGVAAAVWFPALKRPLVRVLPAHPGPAFRSQPGTQRVWYRHENLMARYSLQSPVTPFVTLCDNRTLPAHLHRFTHTHIHTDSHTQIHTHTRMHKHTNTDSHTHTCTHTDSHTHTHTDSHAHTHTDSHTHIHMLDCSHHGRMWLPCLHLIRHIVKCRHHILATGVAGRSCCSRAVQVSFHLLQS